MPPARMEARMHEVILQGCRPRPLAGYLKALGIFSLVSRQIDAQARGCWGASGFVLHSKLDKKDLENFLLHDYAPTPLVTPWNKGSGFYDKGDALDEASAEHAAAAGGGANKKKRASKKNGNAPDRIRATEHDRFKAYRETIESIFAWPEFADAGDAGVERMERLKAWCAKDKADILLRCRNTLPDDCVDWLDAAFILHGGKNSSCPPLLGSGGNDGKLEFARTFMECLVELFIDDKGVGRSAVRLGAALWSTAIPGTGKAALGQFDPGNVGGVNQGMGFKHEDVPANPWDCVLALEGTLLFAGSLSRRNAADPAQATAPFTVKSMAAGYASSALKDEARGEMWLPLWRHPVTLRELRALLREGRATLKRRQARSGLEFARAVSTLGVDRGIDAFERYVFLKRRGRAFSALPVGCVPVRHQPQAALLDEIALLLESAGRIKKAPVSLERGLRRLEQAMFACSLQPAPRAFQNVCLALAGLDALPVIRNYRKPFWGLSTRWIDLCDDGTVEVRLAAALASLDDARQDLRNPAGRIGPARCQIQAVDARKPNLWAEKNAVLWHGSSLYDRLGNLLLRRMMEAQRQSVPENAFIADVAVHPEDALALALGQVETQRLEGLFRAFACIDFRKPEQKMPGWKNPVIRRGIPHIWRVLKLAHLPPRTLRNALGGELMRPEPRVGRLLWAGRLAEACRLAEHRLRVSGLAPRRVRHMAQAGEGLKARAVLASLLVPVHSPRVVAGNILNMEMS